ncbi:Kiwa anti-phage protein KwaB-like domain-containing protein [Fodinicurvata halophila]|uniref:Kiwa anti-phage protein KwaB-like domain-containing protein n=1 Tax=Fodinicurvata halophila TaxID=1419723 RepID=A0ABV8UNZ2_9PROT
MPVLEDIRALDFDNSQVTFWTIKGPNGLASEAPKYSGKWVETTDQLDAFLKTTLVEDLLRIEEVLDYGLLTQNNEASALHIPTDETYAHKILVEIQAEISEKKVTKVKQLLNSSLYLAKIIIEDDVIIAVRKTDSRWRTKKAANLKNIYFSDEQLAIDNCPHFELSKTFDFIIFRGDILILNKGAFESVLRHKQAQKDDFAELLQEEEFHAAFVDVAPLVNYIGDNKIQLRRACAIRMKGHYRDADFMERLRVNQAEYGFNIHFDVNGKIIATEESCPQIMKALLDHRLKSGFSTHIYDVQDTTPVLVR